MRTFLVMFVAAMLSVAGCGRAKAAQRPSELRPVQYLAAPSSKLALLIGIDHFQKISGLNGCGNDVDDMKNLLLEFGFKEDDICVLKDSQATYEKILEAFEQHLLNRLPAGDRDAQVVVHFSTHGRQVKDLSDDETDHKDESICTYDSARDGKNDLIDDQIYGISKRLVEKTDHVTFIFDLCHSGDASKGMALPRTPMDTRFGEAPLDKPKFAVNPPAGQEDLYDGRRYVMISGCLADELSYETTTKQGTSRGALTYEFAKYVRESKGQVITYRSVMDQVNSRVNALNRFQHPQLEGPNLDQELFGVRVIRPLAYVLAFRVGEMVRLNAGAAVGVTEGSTYDLYAPGAGTEVFNDAEAAIARLKVEKVRDYYADAKLTKLLRRDKFRGGDVKTAFRAVERTHVYSLTKIALLYSAGGEEPEALRAARKVVESDDVLASHFEFVKNGSARLLVGAEGQAVTLTYPGRADQRPFKRFDTNDSKWTKEFAEELTRWGRWFRVRDLSNPTARITMELNVGSAAGTEKPPRVAGEPERRFFEGQAVQLSVKNTSDRKLHMYLLNLLDDGTVNLLYPQPGGQTTVDPQTSWPIKGVREAEASVLPDRKENREGLLLLMSENPIDPTPLLVRGSKAASGADPLTLLLEESGLNSSKVALTAEPGGWDTRYVEFQVIGKQ